MSSQASSWQCARCGTRNLSSASLCARCGRPRGAPPLRSGATREKETQAPSAAPRARPAPSGEVGSPGFAAVLSGLLPGLGQVYAERWVRGILLFLLPIFAFALTGAFVAFADPLTSLVLRHAPLVTLLSVGLFLAFHLYVVADAFAGRLHSLRGRHALDYLVLGLVALALIGGYTTIYRQSAPWASLAARMFAPFSTRVQQAGADTAPSWSGDNRLNVLVLGVDTRDSDPSSQNTDTMLVMSLDPVNRTAAMLSLPRDILISERGVFQGKINSAFAFGGPKLAERVVSDLLGQPIHAYAVMNFEAFDKIINGVGGVLIDVHRPLRDEAYPTSDFGVERIAIVAGPRLMLGDVALKYARSRHDTNDYSRAARQQQIVAATRTRLAQPDALRLLPSLLNGVGTTVETDLDPANTLPLARSATGISSGDIQNEVLLPCGALQPHCELTETNDGGFYEIPDLAKVRDLAAALLYDPRIRAEGAKVAIQNTGARGTTARDVSDRLARRAYGVTDVTTGPSASSAVVLRDPSKRYTADQLRLVLGNLPIETAQSDGSGPDIIVRIGSDFRGFATDLAK